MKKIPTAARKSAVLVSVCLNVENQTMNTFLGWINEKKTTEGWPLAASQQTIRAIRDRDRLTRMEAMLHELVNLKQILVDRRTNRENN